MDLTVNLWLGVLLPDQVRHLFFDCFSKYVHTYTQPIRARMMPQYLFTFLSSVAAGSELLQKLRGRKRRKIINTHLDRLIGGSHMCLIGGPLYLKLSGGDLRI